MPQSSYRKGSQSTFIPEPVRVIKTKQVKSTLSREFSAFEKYYGIENTPDHAFRKEHYVVDEFIYKSRISSNQGNKKCASAGSRRNVASKPITVPIEMKNMQSNKSITPIKCTKAEPPDKSTDTKKIDWTKVPMDWNNYHRLAVIHKFMDDLESEFPALCTTGVIGRSLENRDLKILKISNSEASNTRVWIDSGIHAREWIAPAVSTYVANYIAKNFDSLPKSARNKDWYFMPVLNPDGYEFTHTTNRMWRKNKAQIRSTLFGVDLNRNFSFGWGGKGSSDEPNNSFYRGPRPFSEPETSAMRDIFLNSGVTFQVYITLHSFGQVIIMPFAYREELAPDYIRLLEGATVMSKAIFDTNGNIYRVGVSKDVMYTASGTSNDWSHGAVGIPFCYLIELRSKKHKFKVPKEEIEESGEEILNCLIALMEFIDNYKPSEIGKNASQTSYSEDSDTITEISKKSEIEIVPKKRSDFNTNATKKDSKSSPLCRESEVQVTYSSDFSETVTSQPVEVQTYSSYSDSSITTDTDF